MTSLYDIGPEDRRSLDKSNLYHWIIIRKPLNNQSTGGIKWGLMKDRESICEPWPSTTDVLNKAALPWGFFKLDLSRASKNSIHSPLKFRANYAVSHVTIIIFLCPIYLVYRPIILYIRLAPFISIRSFKLYHNDPTMETVNRYINAASNVIWGENGSPHAQQHGEEPVSGVQGKGQATDPYDGGNRDEQPGAIQSDINTAPLGPMIKSRHAKSQGTEITSITTPRPPTSISACTSVTPALDISGELTTASESKENKPISSGSTGASGSNDDNTSKQEQRSTSQAEGGESSEAPRLARPQDVSKEALQGPQGPPPRAAENFEKDYRAEKFAGRDEDIENGSPNESSGKSSGLPSSNRSEPSSLGSEKSGGISKVKESVKRHLHHSSK
ncbi:unnamed protein product [Penicillium egyptiacum]|uniref:Uncharacterized protein n=1 Tax=Penicillium egyptiacum TaxID=1303716 RepID=A0A9W4KG75_9EURO|nr:unnamed protein product [Penicillium egyptiacum]